MMDFVPDDKATDDSRDSREWFTGRAISHGEMQIKAWLSRRGGIPHLDVETLQFEPIIYYLFAIDHYPPINYNDSGNNSASTTWPSFDGLLED
jgi:hypothetical protein